MLDRHGKSGVNYYRNSAIGCFEKTGRFDIAMNFDAWLEHANYALHCEF